MHKKISAAVIGLGIVGASVLATGSATSHGYTNLPISRQALCANGTVKDCGPIQYEPQSVEGPKGFPSGGPADGKICSAGNSQFAQLDDPRGGRWPATKVTGGQGYSFTWRLTAPHSTTDFRYYITKNGYNPSRPLTRADLELQPFMSVPYNGTRPGTTVVHQGTIPTQKTGKHLIVGVWTIADTSNAFYACSDVTF
ncbi:lytic polysaccharide monooxygenase auxiliary activity family 9 protein [Streptomyces sp. NPDC004647]|uniref:lytic polysaccharide monooxygenase auxiliary activity family 9 protein n=1 Tax=Streptomyces sp. NPDC004647 TaxID=3154671 RepID=UPI0033A57896